MSAIVYRIYKLTPPKLTELARLERIAFELREADRELREDLDNWEREIAAIVPRDYKEE